VRVCVNDSSGVLVPECCPDSEVLDGLGLGPASTFLDLDFNLWPEAVGVGLGGLEGESFSIELFEFKELVEEHGFPQGGKFGLSYWSRRLAIACFGSLA